MTDRGVRRCALAAAFLVGFAAAPAALPIVAAQLWTETTPSLAYDLTHEPGACLRWPADVAKRRAIETGRLLFRSSAILGGPAARVGLSCEACHSNGRTNTKFFLPELTDRAGAADVTSEWASKVRGDGAMNPRPIPDLAQIPAKTGFGRHNDPSLEHFVHSVIEEEFQGEPLPDAAFGALIAYLRAADPGHCVGPAPLTLDGEAADIRRAVSAAGTADPATARLLLRVAQEAIGRIVERLPGIGFAADRTALEQLARGLGRFRDAPALSAGERPGWMARFDGTITGLSARAHETYFDEAQLRAALARP